jgi:hypothetical protein
LFHTERAAEAALDQAVATHRATVITAFQNVADSLRALQSDADALKREVYHRLSVQIEVGELISFVSHPYENYVVDLFLLNPDNLDAPWPAAFHRGNPLNVIASASLLERLHRQQPERLAALPWSSLPCWP